MRSFQVPLGTLEDGGNLGYSWWSTTNDGSPRLVQGASATCTGPATRTPAGARVPVGGRGNSIAFWNVDFNGWNGGTLSAPGP